MAVSAWEWGKGLARAGARVVVAARNEEKSREALNECAPGIGCPALSVDVTDERSVAAMMEEAAKQCGGIDILVNNAGMSIRNPVHLLAPDDWRKVLDTNLTGAFCVAAASIPS
jgi:2-deoxy-D-gluconate 3-dehydrogenase